MMRGSDLVRSAGDGFTVSARYVPTLAAPVLAVVDVRQNGRSVCTLTVPAVDGFTVFRHPAVFLPAYRVALGEGEPCLA